MSHGHEFVAGVVKSSVRVLVPPKSLRFRVSRWPGVEVPRVGWRLWSLYRSKLRGPSPMVLVLPYNVTFMKNQIIIQP
ncbi:hypothetical protein TNCV_2313501 [Trichonephila clavipes]|nr:hypothetical protein TNCV_2313501 [Trichonephila clavipes]